MSYKDYPISPDTTPDAEALMFELLGKKSAAEKLLMVGQMSATVRTLAMSGLRERYPDDTDLQLKIRLVELLYGADVSKKFVERFEGATMQ